MPVVFFALVGPLTHLFLQYSREGRFIYMMGDNPLAARTTGAPVRALIVLQYVLTSLIALFVGLMMSMPVASMNTCIVSSTLVYDVILVVVLGGALRTRGIFKPWSPTRSYGLLVKLDSRFRPVASFHSRADGQHHGVTSWLDLGDQILVASQGGKAILSLRPSTGTLQ